MKAEKPMEDYGMELNEQVLLRKSKKNWRRNPMRKTQNVRG